MPALYSVLAKSELIDEIQKSADSQELEFDAAQPWESLSDAADSPIGPHEIQVGLQLLTVALKSAAAMTVFVGALIDLKKKMEKDDKVILLDPKSGKSILKIDEKTTDDAIRRTVEHP